MARKKGNRPEELWLGASYQQIADLKEWIQSRMKRRHADSISAWLLSLGTDEPVDPHKRQLAFFRQILDEYGPPRPAIGGDEPARGPQGTATGDPEGPGTTQAGGPGPGQSSAAGSPRSVGRGSQPAGRFHRA